jgi:hypothetical protein
MSASKERFGSCSRTAWRDASRAQRCPVCASDSWCQIGSGEYAHLVLCKRVASRREKTNSDGITYWVHSLRTERVATRSALTEIVGSVTNIAPASVRHEAYSVLLASLRLCDRHRNNLRARGLRDEDIVAGQYRTLPLEGRARMARTIENAMGSERLAAIPGIVWERRDGRGWWSVRGAPGMLVPSRDLEGRIVALKVRSDELDSTNRYTSVSSRRFGGPSAAVNVHIPRAARERWQRASTLWITEGELKADACSALFKHAIVGIPGVAMWASAIDVVEAMDPRRVIVALDADWQDPSPKKEPVRRARAQLVNKLAALGYDVSAAEWPLEVAKGLDDYLLRVRDARRCAA